MRKPQVFIATDNLNMGGSQKSLLAFLHYIERFCDVDVLVWQKKEREILTLPDTVKRIYIPGGVSVRASVKRYGINSREFVYSVLGAFYKKRWLARPRIKKDYDIAIAFTDLTDLKYYVIDKVNARNKYAFYHNGIYRGSDKVKILDTEYYEKYDRVFVVSEYVKRLLSESLPNLKNVTVLPNRIDLDEIRKKSNNPCSEFPHDDQVNLLTAIRLYPEKNPAQLVEIAKILRDKEINFRWILVGDGPQFLEIKNRIAEEHLENNFILTGNEYNPYRLMQHCDLYVQLSLYEADSLTVREVACFNKHMILSDIPRFRDCQKEFKNIHICKNSEEAVEAIISFYKAPQEINDMEMINRKAEELIYKEIFAGFVSRSELG